MQYNKEIIKFLIYRLLDSRKFHELLDMLRQDIFDMESEETKQMIDEISDLFSFPTPLITPTAQIPSGPIVRNGQSIGENNV